jgi:peptide deformylase
MLRPIRTHPDPVLREFAAPVARFSDETKTLIRDMFETMYAAPGIGLAANQVGVLLRVVTIDLMPDGVKDEEDKQTFEELKKLGFTGPVALVNPQITTAEGTFVWEEGCLSVPETNAEIERAEHVVVTALDRDGKPISVEAHGLFAVAIQHEIDHLNGKLFIDYLSKFKRDTITRRLTKAKEKQLSA